MEPGRLYDGYNIGSGDWIRVMEMADVVVEETGLKDVKCLGLSLLRLMVGDGLETLRRCFSI